MKVNKNIPLMVVALMLISFLSACVVVTHDGHHHHHWHEHPVHEDIIVR